MNALIRLYPAAWRDRYGPEFEGLLAERPPTFRDRIDLILGAIDARLSPQVEATRPGRRVPVGDRLSGAAAIAGGLIWCLTYLAVGLLHVDDDLTPLILAAIGLMLLSLPGTYIGAYLRPVALGCLAFGLSIGAVLAGVLPWGPMLLMPLAGIAVVLGPGALALAAARARIRAHDRWRLLVLTMTWPVLGFVIVGTGVVSDVAVPFAVVAVLPIGIAWIATGARLVRGIAIPTSTISTGSAA